MAVAISPASAQVRAVATTQGAALEPDGETLALGGKRPNPALRLALRLRRWSLSGPAAAERAAIGIAWEQGPETTGREAKSLARELAETARPGAIVAERGILEAADANWLTGLDIPGHDHERVEVRWRSDDGARPFSLPLPAPILNALDRPWAMLGREREIESMARRWADAVEGGGSAHLIAGEPGAGKTRLVAEVARQVHEAGGLVLYGTGETPSALPFPSFAQAIRHLDRGGGELAELIRDSPLRSLADGSQQTELRRTGGLGTEGAATLAAASEALQGLAALQPALLVIEDLHECTTSSLRLLAHLASRGGPNRILILTTYRPTELEPGDERSELIDRFRSAADGNHVELPRLDEEALRGVAAALRPDAETSELSRVAVRVRRETEGNALFACELLRGRAESPATAPPRSLRVLIASRARGLGGTVLEHLGAAAVAGRVFEPTVLASALDAELEAVLRSVDLAERAGLLTIDPADGSCSFTHAITMNSLRAELGSERRGALHRRLAETIEAQPDAVEQRTEELARHFELAEPPDPERAARYCELAAEQALGGHDGETAAAWFERALELSARAPGARDADRCRLLIGLGIALRPSGRPRFREVLLEAARIAERIGDVELLTQAVLNNHRGFPSMVSGFDRERINLLELTAERMDDDGPEMAMVLAQLAVELIFAPGPIERRRELADAALRMARATGSESVLARVLIRVLMARWSPTDPRERIALAEECIALSTERDEPLVLFHALHWQACARIELREVENANSLLVEQRRVAERIGDQTAAWLCACAEALHLNLRGELDASEVVAQRAVELAQSCGQPDALPFYFSQLASIRWLQGRMGELAPLLTEATAAHPDLPGMRSLASLAHAHAGDRDAGLAVLEVDTSDGFTRIPRDPIWAASMGTYAHAIVALGDRDAAARLLPLIDGLRGRIASTTVSIWGVFDHILGRLELMLGREAEAGASLATAIDLYAGMNAPVWRALAAADLIMEGGADRDGSGLDRLGLVSEARRVAKRSGAGLVLASVDGGREGVRDELSMRVERLGLTARQAELVRLVADGKTNREIAAELQISASTVKRHLENIYERTGARTRGALLALLLDG